MKAGREATRKEPPAGNPMRIAVIADIHGNLPALEAVLADIQRRGVDRTINLGDSVSGPPGHVKSANCSWHQAVS